MLLHAVLCCECTQNTQHAPLHIPVRCQASTACPRPCVHAAHLLWICSVHPEEIGQQVLAELLSAPLLRAVQEASIGVEPSTRSDSRLTGLPPAMIPNNPARNAGICAIMASSDGLDALL